MVGFPLGDEDAVGGVGLEHTADVDVHNGRVGVVGGEVHTETAAKVVGGTHNGAESVK